MIHLAGFPGIRIDDMRAAAFRRPLLTLPESGKLLLPICAWEDQANVQVLPKKSRVKRFEPIARKNDGTPLCYAPTAGEVGDCIVKDIPGTGKMICMRLQTGKSERSQHSVSKTKKEEPEAQTVLRAAQLLQIKDETDGEPLYEKLKKYLAEPIDLLLCDAICDDPFMADGLCVLTERSDAVLDGLQLAAMACGCKETAAAVFRGKAAGFGAMRRLKKGMGSTKLLNLNGRYPILPALKKNVRFSKKKIGTIGAQACLHLSNAVRLGRPVERCIVTVSGEGVERPQNFSVVIGTPLSEVLSQCRLWEEDDIIAVCVGGSFNGFAVTDMETPVLPQTRCVLAFTGRERRRLDRCIGCGRCNEVCIERVFVSQASLAARNGNLQEARAFGADRCIGCRACDVICPGGVNPSDFVLGAVRPKSEKNG